MVALFFYMKFSEFLRDPISSRDHLLLIGNPVSHSISPIMHNLAIDHYALDLEYVAVEILNDELEHARELEQAMETINGTLSSPA